MNSKLHPLIACVVAGLASLISSCQKNPEKAPGAPAPAPASARTSMEVVKETERSRNFLAVSKQLELGGTVFGYVDIDGDVLKLADTIKSIAGQVVAAQPDAAPFLSQDFKGLFKLMGLDDVKAVGLSSVPEAGGFFRNRVFFYTPDSRHGLMAGFGGKPTAFKNLRLAPADADFYMENEVDVPAVYSTIREITAKVAGDAAANTLETQLKQAGERAGIALYSTIMGLKGRTTVVMRLDPESAITLPTPETFSIPSINLLIAVEGVGSAIEPSLAAVPLLKMTKEDGMSLYSLAGPLPIPNLEPAIAIEGNTLYLVTRVDFLRESRKRTKGLDTDPVFQKALAAIGPEGNGLTYVSPRFFERLRQLDKMNPGLAADARKTLAAFLDELPKADRPLISVRSNLPDGILVRSFWTSSLKQDLAVAAMYNPFTIGLVAAMAIPAFQKVQEAAQMAPARGGQPPPPQGRAGPPPQGRAGQPPQGRAGPPPQGRAAQPAPQDRVMLNLRQLAAASDQYMLENGTRTATYGDLVGPNKYIRSLPQVAGEDYSSLKFVLGQPIQVTLPSGVVVKYDR